MTNSTAATAPRPKRPSGGTGAMFDNIADRYDLLNRIISLGIDQSWRKQTVDCLGLSANQHALDLATGTGDLAIMIAKRCAGVNVTGVDPSTGMLSVGLRKIASKNLQDRVTLKNGDAQSLPFGDNSFDGTTIAFGIRNVPDRAKGLSEMARVTKPNGRVAILELSEPEGGLMGAMARFHVHTVVPWVGSILSGAKEYRYLQKSIAAFPTPQEFSSTMEKSGLEIVQVIPLTFGVAHLYIATPRKAD